MSYDTCLKKYSIIINFFFFSSSRSYFNFSLQNLLHHLQSCATKFIPFIIVPFTISSRVVFLIMLHKLLPYTMRIIRTPTPCNLSVRLFSTQPYRSTKKFDKHKIKLAEIWQDVGYLCKTTNATTDSTTGNNSTNAYNLLCQYEQEDATKSNKLSKINLCSQLIEACIHNNELISAKFLYQNVVLLKLGGSNRMTSQQVIALVHALVHAQQTRQALELLQSTYTDVGWMTWNNAQQTRISLYYQILKGSGHAEHADRIDQDFQLSQEILNSTEKHGDAKNVPAQELSSLYSLMIRIMFLADKPSHAQEIYQKLVARGKNSSNVCVAMIKGLARCGQLDRAEALFRDAVLEAEQINQEEPLETDDKSMKLCSSSSSSRRSSSSSSSKSRFIKHQTKEMLNDEQDELFDAVMFEDQEPFDWMPETTRFTGDMKFYNVNRGFGIVLLKNNQEIFIHGKRSFIILNDRPILKLLENNENLSVDFEIVDGVKGKEARELRICMQENNTSRGNFIPMVEPETKPTIQQHLEQQQQLNKTTTSFSLRETYHAMIETYARSKKIDQAQWLFDEMRSQDHIFPEIKTYDVMIHALSKIVDRKEEASASASPVERAKKLIHSLSKMIDRKEEPSPVVRAKELFLEITQSTHDQRLYATMIRALVEQDDINGAEEMYTEMIEMGYTPTIDIVNSLKKKRQCTK